jgi:hypothetical protein
LRRFFLTYTPLVGYPSTQPNAVFTAPSDTRRGLNQYGEWFIIIDNVIDRAELCKKSTQDGIHGIYRPCVPAEID